MKALKKILSLMLCFCLLLSLPIYIEAADTSFEKSISGFPESYRVYLREMHKDHPKWEFVPLKTGIKFDTAVNNEMLNGRSLVSNWSAYTDYFKSKESGDYNYSTGRYIEKDGGFVTANKLAVSFFMDPRNSLNEENIFQFEDLSFNEEFTVEAIGVILSNAYCPPEYKDKPTQYYKEIYNAGKAYNVNPCYLAAKIKNEIGTGSASVYGTNSSYPGIYNFYNIGASDGAGAITRGLAWAASGSSYNRPWTSAKKSIVGGAEFIASNYIAEGQYTGYLQKFNVNPKSSYGLYNHQYMTNISGSMSQGYSTYLSYLSIGIIDNYFRFSIPVFDNMPGHNDNSGSIYPTDASSQSGKISASYCNVRKGPSTNNDLHPFQLVSGTSVTILDCVKTDSKYYDSIFRYPYWYKIKFIYDSKSYQGYVPSTFVSLTSSVDVAVGEYKPSYKSDNSALSMNIVSYDTRYATVTKDTAINFISTGSVQIGFYDSTGRFRIVNYNIADKVDTPPAKVSGLSVQNAEKDSLTLSWKAVNYADGYRVYMYNADTAAYKAYVTTSKTSCDVTDLSAGTDYKFKVRAYTKSSTGTNLWGSYSSVLTAKTVPEEPAKPKNLTQTQSSTNFITLQWDKVEGADGYDVYMFDYEKNSFEPYSYVTEPSCTVSGLSPSEAYKIAVKSYMNYNNEKYRSLEQAEKTVLTGPNIPTDLTQNQTTVNSYNLKWKAVNGADGYIVYKIDMSDYSYVQIGKVTEPNILIDSIDSGEFCAYSIVAFRKSGNSELCSAYSEEYLATTRPDKVKGITQSSTNATGYKLKWNKVKNATAYYVYKLNDKGEYKKIASVKTNSYTVTSLTPGATDKYKIRAYIKCNGKTYWGDYSSVFKGYTAPDKVTELKKTNLSSGGYKVSWTKVSKATGYKVYTYNKTTKEYKVYSTTKSNYIKVTKKGTNIYAVRAYRTVNGVTYYGKYSAKITVKY